MIWNFLPLFILNVKEPSKLLPRGMPTYVWIVTPLLPAASSSISDYIILCPLNSTWSLKNCAFSPLLLKGTSNIHFSIFSIVHLLQNDDIYFPHDINLYMYHLPQDYYNLLGFAMQFIILILLVKLLCNYLIALNTRFIEIKLSYRIKKWAR